MSPLDSKTTLHSDPRGTSARGVYVDRPGFNIYTMMLVLAFLALVTGSVFMYLELYDYGPGKPWVTGM